MSNRFCYMTNVYNKLYNIFYKSFRHQPNKMVKHTQKIRRQFFSEQYYLQSLAS